MVLLTLTVPEMSLHDGRSAGSIFLLHPAKGYQRSFSKYSRMKPLPPPAPPPPALKLTDKPPLKVVPLPLNVVPLRRPAWSRWLRSATGFCADGFRVKEAEEEAEREWLSEREEGDLRTASLPLLQVETSPLPGNDLRSALEEPWWPSSLESWWPSSDPWQEEPWSLSNTGFSQPLPPISPPPTLMQPAPLGLFLSLLPPEPGLSQPPPPPPPPPPDKDDCNKLFLLW
jgi:hypothetical protein